MTVVNPKSISGINSITTGSGSDDILTIHTNNGTERLRVDSTGATKIVTGIVTTLTATTGIVTTLTSNTTTLNSTTTATGNINVSGANITLGDSGGSNDDRIKLGAGGDLSIYHDGSNSYLIDSGDGDLIINSDSTISLNPNGGGHYGLRVITNGSCELYEANSKKLETTSTGVTVTGQIISDGLQMGDSEYAKFGSHDDLQLYHDGSDSYIKHNGTGNFYVQTSEASVEDLFLQAGNDVYIRVQTGETAIKAIGDGAVELYHDNSKKLQTQSDGVEILSTGSWHGLEVKHSNGNIVAKLQNKGSGDEGYLALYDSGGAGPSIQMDGEHGRLTCDQIRIGGNNAANQLEDYEEGTWTPSGFCDGGGLTVNGAAYTKIGQVVYIYMYVSGMNIPNTACEFKIYGLPFTVTNSNDHFPALAIGYSGGGNLPAEVRFLCRANNTYIYSHMTAGNSNSRTNQDIRAYLQNQALILTGFYFTDS